MWVTTPDELERKDCYLGGKIRTILPNGLQRLKMKSSKNLEK